MGYSTSTKSKGLKLLANMSTCSSNECTGQGGIAPVAQCRQEIRSIPLGAIKRTSGEVQKLTDKHAVLCSAGAGASDNIDG